MSRKFRLLDVMGVAYVTNNFVKLPLTFAVA